MIVNGRALLQAGPIKGMLDRKVRGGLTSYGLSEAGYDIRIKQEIMFHPANGADPNEKTFVDGRHHPSNFVIASAIEEFDMPYDLVGIVHDKSTWARKGLSVFNTVIEPGWRGFLTLELVYHGFQPLHIPAGTGIAQVIFHRTERKAEYTGKYQDQADRPVGAING